MPGEMPLRGLRHLRGGREMDEAVLKVDRRAAEAPAASALAQSVAGQIL